MAVVDGPSAQDATQTPQHRLQPEGQQAPAPPPPPSSAQPLPLFTVRRYDHARDHARLAYICRDVYGGTDDLPEVIGDAASRKDTHLLVASSGGAGGQLDALLCCQQRGDVLWLYGARTAEERRGTGLAQLLLAEAEALAGRLPGVAALLSVTITANPAMRRAFARRGLRPQRGVVVWPAHAVVQEVHSRLAAQEQEQQQEREQEQQQQQRQQQDQQERQERQQGFLAGLPATAAVVDSAAARGLLPHWRGCRSVDELSRLLHHLRRADARRCADQPHAEQPAAAAEEWAAGAAGAEAPPGQVLGAASAAFHWLPGEYELLPAGGPAVQALVQAGQAWLLEAPGPAAGAGPARASHSAAAEPAAAILLCLGPSSRGVRRAGVAASSAAALESALLHAAETADPGCCRFYVDCCGFQHEALWATAGGERADVMPHFKPLA